MLDPLVEVAQTGPVVDVTVFVVEVNNPPLRVPPYMTRIVVGDLACIDRGVFRY